MGLIGIQYRHPLLYKALIPLIHRKSVIKEFHKQVGKNVSVFDVAAGFGMMAQYIDPANTYTGIDLNKTFVEYGRKQGLDIAYQSIFDEKAYKLYDVLILVDVIHHLPPEKLPELFDLLFKYARQRIVILEPAFLDLKKRYGVFGSLVDSAMKKFDSDGLNKIDRWLSHEEYKKLFDERFNSPRGKAFSLTLKTIYPYYVVTFTKTSSKIGQQKDKAK